jgi:type IV secretory pathway VirJ component
MKRPRRLEAPKSARMPLRLTVARTLTSLARARALSALLLLCACMAGQPASATVEHLSFGQFGQVSIYRTGPNPKAVVVFLSGEQGWGGAEETMAQGLAGLDALVIGVDFNVYHRKLSHSDDACLYPAGSLENLSKLVQKKLGLPRYMPPIVVGYGASAPLAYASLAQAPAGTFLGAISLGFCPELALSRLLCEGSGLANKLAPGGAVKLLPAARLEQPWIAVVPEGAAPCAAAARAFAGQVPGAALVALPPPRHGASEALRWMARLKQSYLRLYNAADLQRPPESATLRQLPDLPLLELPANGAVGDALAVMVSGDGGWTGVDRQIAGVLAERGMPVVGVNTLQYFWTPRTPEKAAADLARILRTYLPAWHRQEAVLIGYSLGAEVLPFMAGRLPADLLAKVRMVTLMGPGRTTSFEFRESEMRGHGGGQNLPVLPELKKLKDKTVLCMYGEREKDDSLCTQSGADVKAVNVTGGHYLGDDFKAVAEQVLQQSKDLAMASAASAGTVVPGDITSEPFAYGRFGRTIIFRQSPHPKQVVLFLSDAEGFKDADTLITNSLVQLDTLVVTIDLQRYLARVQARQEGCVYLAGNLELLSRAVEKRLALPAYLHPVLMGRGEGAALAYAALAQAPPNTFRGALSLGFRPDVSLAQPLCGEHRLETKPLAGGRIQLLPASGLEQPWTALNGNRDKASPAAAAQEFARHVPGGKAVVLPEVDHAFTTRTAWESPLREAFVRTVSAVPPPVAGETVGSTVLTDLPVVEMPARGGAQGDSLAIIYSGDGGWAGVDRELGKVLSRERGMPVVGVDCLQYFWSGRTPERAAADLARMLRHYLAASGRKQALLIGYSLGADVLPFMVSRLPADLREKVALVALIGPSHSAPMEIRVTEDKATELPVLPEVKKLRGWPLLCVAGQGEQDSLCPDLDAQLARRVELPGAHAFDGNYPALADHILEAAHHPPAAAAAGQPAPATPPAAAPPKPPPPHPLP